jgi:hypothetical protein
MGFQCSSHASGVARKAKREDLIRIGPASALRSRPARMQRWAARSKVPIRQSASRKRCIGERSDKAVARSGSERKRSRTRRSASSPSRVLGCSTLLMPPPVFRSSERVFFLCILRKRLPVPWQVRRAALGALETQIAAGAARDSIREPDARFSHSPGPDFPKLKLPGEAFPRTF